MPISLRQRLNELASSFVSQVLDAIRGSSLRDLISGPKAERAAAIPGRARESSPRLRKSGGRLPRRSQSDIASVVESIVSLLKQKPHGLRAEQIREMLELQAKELPRPLKEALDSGRLSKSGQKRATTYFAKGVGAKREAPSPRRASAGGARKNASRRGASTRHGAARGRRGVTAREVTAREVIRSGGGAPPETIAAAAVNAPAEAVQSL